MKKEQLQAIKKFCYECSGENNKEVEMCPSEKCPLYIYRNGKDPNKVKRNLNEEQRNAMIEHMKVMRESKKK